MGGLSPAGLIGGGTIIGQITFSTLSLYNNNQTGIFFTNTAGTGACIRNTGSQQIGIHVGSAYNRAIVVGEGALYNKNYDWAAQTDPVFAVHSATDPDTDNTQYIALQHNQTDGLLLCGKGAIQMTAPAAAPTLGADSRIAFSLDETGGNVVITVRESDSSTHAVTLSYDP